MSTPRDRSLLSFPRDTGRRGQPLALPAQAASDSAVGFGPDGLPHDLGNSTGGIVLQGDVSLSGVATQLGEALVGVVPVGNRELGFYLAWGATKALVFTVNLSTMVIGTIGLPLTLSSLMPGLSSAAISTVVPAGDLQFYVVAFNGSTLSGQSSVFLWSADSLSLVLTCTSYVQVANSGADGFQPGVGLPNACRLSNGFLAVPVTTAANPNQRFVVRLLAFEHGCLRIKGDSPVVYDTVNLFDSWISLSPISECRLLIVVYNIYGSLSFIGFHDDLGGDFGVTTPLQGGSGEVNLSPWSINLIPVGLSTVLCYGEPGALSGGGNQVSKLVFDGHLSFGAFTASSVVDAHNTNVIAGSRNLFFSWGPKNSKVSYFQPDDLGIVGESRIYTWDWDGQELLNQSVTSVGALPSTIGSNAWNFFVFPYLSLVNTAVSTLRVYKVPVSPTFDVIGLADAPVSTSAPQASTEVTHDPQSLSLADHRYLSSTSQVGRLLLAYQDIVSLVRVDALTGAATWLSVGPSPLLTFVTSVVPAELPSDGASNSWWVKDIQWVDAQFFTVLCQSFDTVGGTWGTQFGIGFGAASHTGEVIWKSFKKTAVVGGAWDNDCQALTYVYANNLYKYFAHQVIENGIPRTEVIRQEISGSFTVPTNLVNGVAGTPTWDTLVLDGRTLAAFRGSPTGVSTNVRILRLGVNYEAGTWTAEGNFAVSNLMTIHRGPVEALAGGLPMAVVDDDHVLVSGVDAISGLGHISVVNVRTLAVAATYLDPTSSAVYDDDQTYVLGRRYGGHFVVVGSDNSDGQKIKAWRFAVDPVTYAVSKIGGLTTIVNAYGTGRFQAAFDGYDLVVSQFSSTAFDKIQFTVLSVFNRLLEASPAVTPLTTVGRKQFPGGAFLGGRSYFLDRQGDVVPRTSEFYLGEAVAPDVLDIHPTPWFTSFAAGTPGEGRFNDALKPMVPGLSIPGENLLATSGNLVIDQAKTVHRIPGDAVGSAEVRLNPTGAHMPGVVHAVLPAGVGRNLTIKKSDGGSLLHPRSDAYLDYVHGFAGAFTDGRVAKSYKLSYRGDTLNSNATLRDTHVWRVDDEVAGKLSPPGLIQWLPLLTFETSQPGNSNVFFPSYYGIPGQAGVSPLPAVTSMTFVAGPVPVVIDLAPHILGGTNPFALNISQLNPDRGSIEFWLLTDDILSLVDGAVYRILSTLPWNASAPDLISVSYVRQSTVPGAEALLRLEYGASTVVNFALPDASRTIVQSTWYHLALSWDRTAATNKVVMFFNGVPVMPTVPATVVDFSRANTWLAVFNNPLAPAGGESHWNGAISGIKLWDFQKLNFEDRYLGGYPAVYQPGMLAAPPNLTAVAATHTQINLQWGFALPQGSGYKVEKLVGLVWTEIADLASTVFSYPDTGLTAETLYIYRVKTYGGVNSSPYSLEASATTPAAPPLFNAPTLRHASTMELLANPGYNTYDTFIGPDFLMQPYIWNTKNLDSAAANGSFLVGQCTTQGSVAMRIQAASSPVGYLWCASALVAGLPTRFFRAYFEVGTNILKFQFGDAEASLGSGYFTPSSLYDLCFSWNSSGLSSGNQIEIRVDDVVVAGSLTSIAGETPWALTYPGPVAYAGKLVLGSGYGDDFGPYDPSPVSISDFRVYGVGDTSTMPGKPTGVSMVQSGSNWHVEWTLADALDSAVWVYVDFDSTPWSRIAVLPAGSTSADFAGIPLLLTRVMVMAVDAFDGSRRWSDPTAYQVLA